MEHKANKHKCNKPNPQVINIHFLILVFKKSYASCALITHMEPNKCMLGESPR